MRPRPQSQTVGASYRLPHGILICLLGLRFVADSRKELSLALNGESTSYQLVVGTDINMTTQGGGNLHSIANFALAEILNCVGQLRFKRGEFLRQGTIRWPA